VTAVRVRLDVDVTIRVPHEITVEVEEFDDWLRDHGHVGPSWEGDVTDHHEQLIAFLEDDDENLRDMPYPDLRKHELASADIADVEVLGSAPEHQQETTP
jgi:hypothetical protein